MRIADPKSHGKNSRRCVDFRVLELCLIDESMQSAQLRLDIRLKFLLLWITDKTIQSKFSLLVIEFM